MGLTVQQEGIPVRFSVEDGNTPESTIYRTHLERVAAVLADVSDRLFVGDSKLCDAHTLGGIRAQGMDALTLLPVTFSAREALLRQQG